MSSDKAIQDEPLPLKALTLGDNSTTAEVHAWIRAWHSLHLVTIPSGAGENLNQIFWDGQYIFGKYDLYKDLKTDLYRWGFDEGRTRAVLHDLYRAKPKPVPTAFEIEKKNRQQEWIKFVLTVVWSLLFLYLSWKCGYKVAARRLADSTGSLL